MRFFFRPKGAALVAHVVKQFDKAIADLDTAAQPLTLRLNYLLR